MSGHLSLANGKRLPIHDGFVLGRVAGCDLVIDDGKASRRHARIHVESGVVEIEDMQSSNGTLLNDKPVTRRVLRDGDRVQIGKTVIVFHDAEIPGEQPAAPKPVVAVYDDDDDLLGAAATSIAAAPPPPPPTPPPPPPPRPTPAPAPPVRPVVATPRPLPASTPPPPAPPAPLPAPAPPPPPSPEVVEFADEVVEIRKPAAPAPAAAAKPAAGGAQTVTAAASRVLQFSKQAGGGGGLLGDDMGQMAGGMRALLVLGAVALGAGVVWLMMRLVG